MITYYLMSALWQLLVNMIGRILPVADPVVLQKFTDTLDLVTNAFMTLAYYYLPMDAVIFFFNTIIATYLLSLTIKFTLRMLSISTGGLIKTDRI